MVTERILTRRRLYAGRGEHLAGRRRRSARPLLEQASSAAARRLQLSAFARVYAGGAVVLVMAIAYLVVAAQATQVSYQLSQLKAQQAQLQADQDQLRYRSVTLHGPARIDEEASGAGLERRADRTYATAQPVTLDLRAPIGPDRPDETPAWQRALAAVFEGGRDAMAREG